MLGGELISIVVPVYKVEYWLPKCINSLLSQTYNNIEIILINDGSPDKSGEICDNYAKKDQRIKVIHKENGGVSSARNKGIDMAMGEYIFFIDSDDWLALDAIETMYAEFIKNDIQICIANSQIIGKTNSLYRAVHKEQIISFSDADKLFLSLYQEISLGGIINKMFSSSLIKNNSIRFREGMKFGEDVLFLLDCFKYCEAMALIEKSTYFYNRLVTESAITRYYSELVEWMFLLTESRNNLVFEKGQLYKNGDLYITRTALIDFEYIVNAVCLKNRNVDEVIEIYKKSYEMFRPHFDVESIKKNTLEYQIYIDLVVSFCQYNDFVGLYEQTQKKYYQTQNRLMEIVKDYLIETYICIKRAAYRYIL